MSNFAFNNPAFQQQDPRNVATYPGGPQAAQGAQNASLQHGAMDAAANAQLEGMYAAPPAGAIETDRMSVEVRAAMARDPKALERAMARQLTAATISTGR